MNRLVFVGTGGGRHSMSSQTRKTGGTYVELGGMRFIIDPGPGSLVYSRALQLEPEKWDGILLSHLHIDHSSDANALLDGMKGPQGHNEKRDIFLVAEEHCLHMKKDYTEYPRVSMYHQNMVKDLHPVKPDEKIHIGKLRIETTKADHGEPSLGFMITGQKKVGYASDGAYFKGQEAYFEGCDVLLLNVIVPKGGEVRPHLHMSIDDAIRLLKAMSSKPKLAVLRHFSSWMLRANLYKQAKILQDAIGVRTLFAEDFMELDLDRLSTRILEPKF